MTRAPALLIVCAAQLRAGEAITAGEIMRRVIDNMDRAQTARALYVYDQHVFVRMKRANGKLAREESRDYVIAPTEKGARRKLVKVEGKVLEGRKEIPYSDPEFRIRKMDIDGELTDSFAHDLLWSKHGKVDWFPVHKNDFERYVFTLKGDERYRDYDVYRVEYHETKDEDGEKGCWNGEALVERSQFQPVLITAQWDCKIPVAVKMLLGINVQHIGAKITFRRFDNDVWFPVSCGGEMKLRVLFMYARTIAFSASADGFRKADVQSSVQFEAEPTE